jgi:hypothetical protein
MAEIRSASRLIGEAVNNCGQRRPAFEGDGRRLRSGNRGTRNPAPAAGSRRRMQRHAVHRHQCAHLPSPPNFPQGIAQTAYIRLDVVSAHFIAFCHFEEEL